MSSTPSTWNLLPDLPFALPPTPPVFDLYCVVPELLDLNPGWKFDDIRDFIEEKLRRNLNPEDLTTLRAIFSRLAP